MSIVVCSDSHGRHISRLLRENVKSESVITEWVKPNGKMENILETVRAYSSNVCDYVVIMGGTNNIVNERCSLDFVLDLETTLGKMSSQKVILVGLPARHDNPSLNTSVNKVNSDLLSLSSKYNNVTFLSLSSIPRFAFTRHGLHLNFKGKHMLANLLADSMNLSKCSFPIQTPSNSQLYPKPRLNHESVTVSKQINPYPVRSYIAEQSNNHNTRTFVSKHFLGEARKPVGVPWAHFLRETRERIR